MTGEWHSLFIKEKKIYQGLEMRLEPLLTVTVGVVLSSGSWWGGGGTGGHLSPLSWYLYNKSNCKKS